MSVKPGTGCLPRRPEARHGGRGAFFVLSAIGFRGAILELGAGSFLMRATTTLAWSLGTQTALVAWLGLFGLARRSLFGGVATIDRCRFPGALASQFWFIGFSLTTAANVRTSSSSRS